MGAQAARGTHTRVEVAVPTFTIANIANVF